MGLSARTPLFSRIHIFWRNARCMARGRFHDRNRPDDDTGSAAAPIFGISRRFPRLLFLVPSHLLQCYGLLQQSESVFGRSNRVFWQGVGEGDRPPRAADPCILCPCPQTGGKMPTSTAKRRTSAWKSSHCLSMFIENTDLMQPRLFCQR